MRLTVRNLGVISKAEVDLGKDLIILTGENNTGKTYLAYTICCACVIPSPSGFSGFANYFPEAPLFDNGKMTYNLSEAIAMILSRKLKQRIPYFFAVENEFFEQTEFKVTLSDEDLDMIKRFEINKSGIIDSPDPDFVELKANYKIYKEKGKYDLIFEIDEPSLSGRIPSQTIEEIIKGLLPKVFTITAERTGINLFHKELAVIKNKVFDSILTNGKGQEILGFLNKRFNKYPKPIKDSLEIAQNFDAIQKQKSEFAYLGKVLEEEFLNGSIHLSDDGDIRFTPAISKRPLEVHMTSSTVKSLASLSIYLKHIAKTGDFIIIDEPEANLHPNSQIKMARFIARLVNEGFKVMISTHSDYIIRELNSLIMLGAGMKNNLETTKKLMQENGYIEKQILQKEQLGVYLFRQGKDVEEVKVEETGFEIASIDETVDILNKTSQSIYYELFD